MSMRLVINVGFITNSSSVIHWFPKEILNDEDVQAFLKAYQLEDGYVGEDLWYRSACGSFLRTKEQYEEATAKLNDAEYSSAPTVGPVDGSHVAVIYGDEHQTIFMELSHLLSTAAERMGLADGGTEYN